MKNLRDAINEVLKEHPGIEFRFCRLGQYEAVLDDIAEHFLARGRRDLNQVWMHHSFHEVIATSQPQDIFVELKKRLDEEEIYWFLASEDDGKYWVAEGSGAGIIGVIRKMHDFEYYICDRKMSWILCEDHHGIWVEARGKVQRGPLPIA